MLEKVKKYLKSGLMHSFVASVVNKAVMFLSSVVLARFILSKAAYGFLTISNNVFSIAILFAGLGLGSGLLQFCAEKRPEEERDRIYRYANTIGAVICVVLAAAVYFYGFFNLNQIPESSIYIKISAGLPLFYYLYFNETLYLRANRRIKEYAIVLNSNSLLYAGLSILFGWLWGVWGIILGRYIAYVFSFVVGYLYIRKFPFSKNVHRSLPADQKKALWSFSIMSGVASAINQLVYLIDVNMITTMTRDEAKVAVYKVATMIPDNMAIIPTSFLLVVIPYFALHQADKKWVASNTKKVIGVMALVNVVVVALLVLLAPWIIQLLWGPDYADAVVPFRILSLSYFFLGTFRLTSTQILASQRKAGINMAISIATLVANVILDYLFILWWGINGAAYATLGVVVFSCILQLPIMIRLIRPRKTDEGDLAV